MAKRGRGASPVGRGGKLIDERDQEVVAQPMKLVQSQRRAHGSILAW